MIEIINFFYRQLKVSVSLVNINFLFLTSVSGLRFFMVKISKNCKSDLVVTDLARSLLQLLFFAFYLQLSCLKFLFQDFTKSFFSFSQI